jgi:hypothetical protein
MFFPSIFWAVRKSATFLTTQMGRKKFNAGVILISRETRRTATTHGITTIKERESASPPLGFLPTSRPLNYRSTTPAAWQPAGKRFCQVATSREFD